MRKNNKLNNKSKPNSKSHSKATQARPSSPPARSAKPVKGSPSSFSPQLHRKAEKQIFPKTWRPVTGTHAIAELLITHPKTIQVVLLQSNWKSSAELRALADKLEIKKIKIEEKSEQQLQEISRSHQGAVAFSDLTLNFEYQTYNWGNYGLVLALDGVEDTHNLGAVLRTSWLMGVNGIIIPEDRAVGLTATVHKVACGGVEHVPIHRTNQFVTPFETLKKAGFWAFGLSHKAEKTIYDLKIPEKVIWVLGAEDKGLRGTTEKACDELVSIPQLSPNASYNVSVTAALALGETKRQWIRK